MENKQPKVNSKKRSVGVTLFAIVIIVFAVFSLPFYLNYKVTIESYVAPFGVIFLIAGLLISIGELLLGVNILRLREWARRGIVIVFAGSILLTAVSTFCVDVEQIISIQDSENSNKGEAFIKGFEAGQTMRYGRGQGDLTPEEREFAMATAREANEKYEAARPGFIKGIFLFSLITTVIWCGSVIFFFTRPKVKLQFIGAES